MVKLKMKVTSPTGEVQEGIYGHYSFTECIDSALMCMELNFGLPEGFLRGEGQTLDGKGNGYTLEFFCY